MDLFAPTLQLHHPGYILDKTLNHQLISQYFFFVRSSLRAAKFFNFHALIGFKLSCILPLPGFCNLTLGVVPPVFNDTKFCNNIILQ